MQAVPSCPVGIEEFVLCRFFLPSFSSPSSSSLYPIGIWVRSNSIAEITIFSRFLSSSLVSFPLLIHFSLFLFVELTSRFQHSLRCSFLFYRVQVRYVSHSLLTMREIVHIQAGQCGNQIGAKVDVSEYTHSSIPFRPFL